MLPILLLIQSQAELWPCPKRACVWLERKGIYEADRSCSKPVLCLASGWLVEVGLQSHLLVQVCLHDHLVVSS